MAPLNAAFFLPWLQMVKQIYPFTTRPIPRFTARWKQNTVTYSSRRKTLSNTFKSKYSVLSLIRFLFPTQTSDLSVDRMDRSQYDLRGTQLFSDKPNAICKVWQSDVTKSPMRRFRYLRGSVFCGTKELPLPRGFQLSRPHTCTKTYVTN